MNTKFFFNKVIGSIAAVAFVATFCAGPINGIQNGNMPFLATSMIVLFVSILVFGLKTIWEID